MINRTQPCLHIPKDVRHLRRPPAVSTFVPRVVSEFCLVHIPQCSRCRLCSILSLLVLVAGPALAQAPLVELVFSSPPSPVGAGARAAGVGSAFIGLATPDIALTSSQFSRSLRLVPYTAFPMLPFR